MSDGIPESVQLTMHRLLSGLKRARKERALSRREMAAHGNFTESTVYCLEHGRSDPRLTTYLLLADAVGVLPADDLGHVAPAERAAIRARLCMNTLYVARIASSMTQRQAADALDTSQSCISEWETGEVVPRLSSYLRLAEVVGADV